MFIVLSYIKTRASGALTPVGIHGDVTSRVKSGVRMAQRKPGKRDFLEKNQGKPGKLREFSDHFYNLRENSGNFILPNISDQIGGALRISEASK